MSHGIALVLAEFHKGEAEVMKEEVRKAAEENGLTIVDEVWIPGSMEAPLAAKRLLQRDGVDGLVVLGIIERGETDHGVVMGGAVTKALIDLQLGFMKPAWASLGREYFPSRLLRESVPMLALRRWLYAGCYGINEQLGRRP